MQTIAVIFGGCSSEHDVSLQSASSVIRNIDKSRYEVIPVGITKDGEWFRFTGSVDMIADGTWCSPKTCVHAIISPDRTVQGIMEFHADAIRCIHLDAAFPVLHGRNGEDGTVQGLLALADIPVVGCGVLASAICMDKDRAHKLAHLSGVPVPRSFVLNGKKDAPLADKYAGILGYPLFVKPVKAGSSFGITKVSEWDKLKQAVDDAFEYDDTVILEENIEGFEVGCAVIGSDELITGEVDEIELSKGFFDFTEKYNLITSSIHVPARVPEHKAEEIKQVAKVVYTALGCSGFARVDLFLTPSGEVVFNEINTIPGFTEHSRFPNMMKAAGRDIGGVLTQIIEETLQWRA